MKDKNINGILIDPKERTLKKVSLNRSNYRRIIDLLGCELFTTFGLPNGDVAYLDDEGLIKGEKHIETNGCYKFRWADQTHLVGKTLVLRTTMDGEAASCKSTLEDLEGQVKWVGSPSTQQMDELLTIRFIPLGGFDEPKGNN